MFYQDIKMQVLIKKIVKDAEEAKAAEEAVKAVKAEAEAKAKAAAEVLAKIQASADAEVSAEVVKAVAALKTQQEKSFFISSSSGVIVDINDCFKKFKLALYSNQLMVQDAWTEGENFLPEYIIKNLPLRDQVDILNKVFNTKVCSFIAEYLQAVIQNIDALKGCLASRQSQPKYKRTVLERVIAFAEEVEEVSSDEEKSSLDKVTSVKSRLLSFDEAQCQLALRKKESVSQVQFGDAVLSGPFSFFKKNEKADPAFPPKKFKFPKDLVAQITADPCVKKGKKHGLFEKSSTELAASKQQPPAKKKKKEESTAACKKSKSRKIK